MKQKLLPLLLLILGLLQMLGDLCGIAPLKALAAASGASPAPKVFSAVRGLETYSSRFFIEWETDAGETNSTEVTSERNSAIRGPYNRRNVFGAALAYGPVLSTNEHTKAMFTSVSRYAFCGEAPLLRELGIDVPRRNATPRVRIVPQGRGKPDADLPLLLEIACE